MQISTVLWGTHHHVVRTELYFLCFIFLTEFSNAALGIVPVWEWKTSEFSTLCILIGESAIFS